MQVLGIGTQDSLGEARAFRERADMTAVQLLWDEGFASWDAYGITSQPNAILLSTDGEVLGRWSGFLEPDDVVDALTGA